MRGGLRARLARWWHRKPRRLGRLLALARLEDALAEAERKGKSSDDENGAES
jgi:hypothetical protein